MRLTRTVSVVVFCALGYFRRLLCEVVDDIVMPPAKETGGPTDSNEYEDEPKNVEPEDKHTFVALIDIVFTDANKRSCTGTVIHDRVVITAAHCFVNTKNEFILPELTLSFVVIGTKNMFATGYEHYLPIEKIETHPEFKGWTADLALVYTFAGMQSDKPGKVIPLGGEKSFVPVDSNLTVISWGKCNSDTSNNNYRAKHIEQQQIMAKEPFLRTHDEHVNERESISVAKTPKQPDYQETVYVSSLLHNQSNIEPRVPGSGIGSRYLNINRYQPVKVVNKFSKRGIEFNKTRRNIIHPVEEDYTSYKNWRRVMGTQKNELSVEAFGFVSVQACRKVVERIMPAIYQIKNVNEILCYSSDDHYITKEDSGAPAIQQGSLVAVTVGGLETEGNHIAIGMKMSCFCPWIVDNLPEGGDKPECCTDCCDIKHFKDEETEKKNKRMRGKVNKRPRQRSLLLNARVPTTTTRTEDVEPTEAYMDFWKKDILK